MSVWQSKFHRQHSSSKNKPRTISIFRFMTEKTQNSFSHSTLIGIKHMTYRWKALRKPFLMIPRSHKIKKMGSELLTDYSNKKNFHTCFWIIIKKYSRTYNCIYINVYIPEKINSKTRVCYANFVFVHVSTKTINKQHILALYQNTNPILL